MASVLSGRLVAGQRVSRSRQMASFQMYDLSFFRHNLDAIAKRLADRGFTLDVEAFRNLDAERRAAFTESEQLKAQRNAESQEIGKLRKAGAGHRRPPASRPRNGRQHLRARRASQRARRQIPRAAGRRPQHAARIRARRQIARTITSKSAARARPRSSISRPKPTGISAPNSASSISSAPRRSPAPASPSTGAWARNSNARSSISCSTCTPSSMATPKSCRRSWSIRPASTAPASCRSSKRTCSRSQGTDYYLIPTAEVPVTNLYRDETLDDRPAPHQALRLHALFPQRSRLLRPRRPRHHPPAPVPEGGAGEIRAVPRRATRNWKR